VHDNTELADVIVHGQQQFKTLGTDGITIKCMDRLFTLIFLFFLWIDFSDDQT
jgi:hypothetical protein